jgi:hypothetical protein
VSERTKPEAPKDEGMPLFKRCAYCDLIRLCRFHGRRWLCDECAKEAGLRA